MRMRYTVLYCHLWPVWLYHIFPHNLINGTIFKTKFYWTQNVFWFSLRLLSETFLILRRTERDVIKSVHTAVCCMYSTGYCWQILMNIESSWQIFEKSPNIKFHENPSSGSRVVQCGQTDRQTDRQLFSADRQTDRQTVVQYGQTDRQLFNADRQTDSCSVRTDR
jgi:hypothetical protein